MRKLLFFLVLVAISSTAQAVYKCVGPDGRVTWQDTACPQGSEDASPQPETAPEVRPSTAPSRRRTEEPQRWTLFRQRDDMTDKTNCIAESPSALVGFRGSDIYFARVRVVVASKGQYIVALFSSGELGDAAAFHNDINGLGMRIDDHPFVPVAVHPSSRVLAFSEEDSNRLVEWMEAGSQVRFRVRFWPWDETHDADNVTLDGFRNALTELRDCSGL